MSKKKKDDADPVREDSADAVGAAGVESTPTKTRKHKAYSIRVIDPSITPGGYMVGDAIGDMFIPDGMSPIVVNDGIWRGKLKLEPYGETES